LSNIFLHGQSDIYGKEDLFEGFSPPNVIVKCHRFKGIVHPKINILSFTHTQVVLNLCFFLLLNTK